MALTVVVRAALLPLTIKQFKSMQNMAKFQPEIKKLQERYKGDRERLNQEMMKFYRENKVNPFASCLPLLAQLPVFLALFYMLQHDLRLRRVPGHEPGGHREPAAVRRGRRRAVPLHPGHHRQGDRRRAVTLIVLYVGSQLLSTVLMSTATDAHSGSSSWRCRSSSSIFVINFPAGLLVYWITTNFWTIVQQAIVRKRLGPMRPPTADGEAAPMSIMDRMLHRGDAPTARRTANASAGVAIGERQPGSEEPRPPRPPPPSPRKKKKRSGRRR